ncbi:Vacuolar amino acid transporter 1 [Nymphaea thermarum]|nr:Vacuolar amino acid transporter 1 [Nymphaea thermarum]
MASQQSKLVEEANEHQLFNKGEHGGHTFKYKKQVAEIGYKNCCSCLEANNMCNCAMEVEANDDFAKGIVATTGGQEHPDANSSFTHSVINMIGMLIGLGQLSTPYALENGGWSSIFLLVGLGVICAYTTHVMGKCLKQSPKSRNYQDIGELAFGGKGRFVAALFIYCEIFLALVSYTISLGDNLATIFHNKHIYITWMNISTRHLLTIMAVFISLPSLWLRDFSSISFLSSGGIIMSLMIFATVSWTAISWGAKTNHRIPALQLQNIPGISGLYMFGYAGHVVFPDIYRAMKDPSKFTKVSITSFSIVIILYSSLAFMGAKMFGGGVNSQITLSMPPHLIATKIALWATVLTPMTKYALEFAPIAIQLENALPHYMSSRLKHVIRAAIGSFVLLCILVLALTIPYFQYVLGFTGSLISVGVCIILPSLFYIKISGSQISRATIALNAIFIVIGTLLGVFGTISSGKSLIRSISQA